MGCLGGDKFWDPPPGWPERDPPKFLPGDVVHFKAGEASWSKTITYEMLQTTYRGYSMEAIFSLTHIWETVPTDIYGVVWDVLEHHGQYIYAIYVDEQPRLVHFLEGITLIQRGQEAVPGVSR